MPASGVCILTSLLTFSKVHPNLKTLPVDLNFKTARSERETGGGAGGGGWLPRSQFYLSRGCRTE